MKIKSIYTSGAIMLEAENEGDLETIKALVVLTNVEVRPLETVSDSFTIEQLSIATDSETKVKISKTKKGLEWERG